MADLKNQNGENKGSRSSSGQEPSALERYLAKQKNQPSPTSSNRSSDRSSEKMASHALGKKSLPAQAADPELDLSQPLKPPSFLELGAEWVAKVKTQSENLLSRVRAFLPMGLLPEIRSNQTSFAPLSAVQRVPASFGGRVGAYLVDLVILCSARSWIRQELMPDLSFEMSTVLFCILAFPYFGWFYTHKGASLGKLAMQISVIDSYSGQRIGYWRAFFRESIGKFISFVTFGVGFFMAAVRTDHKALHDLLFETQVVRTPQFEPSKEA